MCSMGEAIHDTLTPARVPARPWPRGGNLCDDLEELSGELLEDLGANSVRLSKER